MIDDYIKYWANLIRESSDEYDSSELLDENGDNPNWSELGRQNIAKEINRLQSEGRLNPIFNSFLGASSVPITFKCRKNGKVSRVRAFLEQGTRDTVGTKKIVYKHLVDGLTAWSGGFTLEELKRDLPSILSRGVANIDAKGMKLIFQTSHGFDWRIGLRDFGNRNRWTVSTICTSRDEKETRKLVNHLRQKCLGPIATQSQKTDNGSGQPDE